MVFIQYLADLSRRLEQPGTGSRALLHLDQSFQESDTSRRATGAGEDMVPREKLMGDTWAIIQCILLVLGTEISI
jgi:hypothetical protein